MKKSLLVGSVLLGISFPAVSESGTPAPMSPSASKQEPAKALTTPSPAKQEKMAPSSPAKPVAVQPPAPANPAVQTPPAKPVAVQQPTATPMPMNTTMPMKPMNEENKAAPTAHKHHSPMGLEDWWKRDDKKVKDLHSACAECKDNIGIVQAITAEYMTKMSPQQQTVVKQNLESAEKAHMDLNALKTDGRPDATTNWQSRFNDCKNSLNAVVKMLPDEACHKMKHHKGAHKKAPAKPAVAKQEPAKPEAAKPAAAPTK